MDGFIAEGGNADDSSASLYGEFSANGFENNISHKRGVISMAHKGEETRVGASSKNSSAVRFFIVHNDSPELDGAYAAFGMVIDGMDVIDKICADAEPINDTGTLAPTRQPIITSVSVHHSH